MTVVEDELVLSLKPCDSAYQRPREAWHMDEDGVAREYIWHPTGGWVRK